MHSNIAIETVLRQALGQQGLNPDAVQLVHSADRAAAQELMRLNGYVDVLIPRGGAGLIRTVVENSTVPVIETGTGNCHIYVDEDAEDVYKRQATGWLLSCAVRCLGFRWQKWRLRFFWRR